MKKKKRIMIVLTGMLMLMACFFYSPKPVQAKELGGPRIVSSSSQSTGVDSLDEGLDRGNGIIVGVLKGVGIALGIITLVVGALGFFGHQDDMKAKFPLLVAITLIIYNAPEIVAYLLGK